MLRTYVALLHLLDEPETSSESSSEPAPDRSPPTSKGWKPRWLRLMMRSRTHDTLADPIAR